MPVLFGKQAMAEQHSLFVGRLTANYQKHERIGKRLQAGRLSVRQHSMLSSIVVVVQMATISWSSEIRVDRVLTLIRFGGQVNYAV